MRYLLDTDTCIYIANRRPAAMLAKFKQEGVLQIGVSIVTEYELYFGAVKSAQKERNMASLTRFFERVSVITWDSVAAHESAQIRADLESPSCTCFGAHAHGTSGRRPRVHTWAQ